MGTDLQALYDSPQPMAQIFFNSFGRKGTLAIWAIVVLVQYVPCRICLSMFTDLAQVHDGFEHGARCSALVNYPYLIRISSTPL